MGQYEGNTATCICLINNAWSNCCCFFFSLFFISTLRQQHPTSTLEVHPYTGKRQAHWSPIPSPYPLFTLRGIFPKQRILAMADEYASHEQLSSQMDISRELENQAAVEAVAAAVAAQDRHREEQAISHSHSPTPSHSHSHPHSHSHSQQPTHDLSQSELPQPGQGPPPPPAYQRIRPASGTSASPLPFPFGPPHRQAPDSPLTNAQQLMVLREFYAKNPNPSKRELEMLAERTGRPWNKIREYFRQRRNKLRGLSDLEGMEEPGRASSW